MGTDSVGALAASGTSEESISLTAPSAGTYYYGACVDAVTGESSANNNCSSSVRVTVPEPVTPQSVEVTPRDVTFASLGATAALTARVLDAQDNEIFGQAVSWSSNFPEVATVNAAGVVTAVADGSATVTASASGVSGEATVDVYQRAASAAIDPGEVELTSVGGTATVTLRAFDANGHEAPDAGNITSWRWQSANPNVATVHPFPVIDPRAQVRAVGAGMTEVTVAAVTEDGVSLNAKTKVTVTIAQYPDLEVETPSVSDDRPDAGESFTLSATVRNRGNGAAAVTTLRYYRSTDATITSSDTQVGTDSVGALAASGTSEESISLTAPSAGTYYYGACVDAVTGESSANNNCSSSVRVDVPAPSKPDLIIPAVLAGSSVAGFPAGGSFELSATVSNRGNGAAEATTLRYYRSDDATITASDTSEGTDEVPGLAASGSSLQSVDLTAPSSPGTYYFGACVDAVPNESDTTNNCSSVRVTVSEPEESTLSLEISTEDDKEWAPVGDTVDLSASVLDEEGEEITVTTVKWSSSNPTVATVEFLGRDDGRGRGYGHLDCHGHGEQPRQRSPPWPGPERPSRSPTRPSPAPSA